LIKHAGRLRGRYKGDTEPRPRSGGPGIKGPKTDNPTHII